MGAEVRSACYGIPVFADALHTLSEQLGVSNVYVATDNAGAVSLLQVPTRARAHTHTLTHSLSLSHTQPYAHD